MTSRMCRGGYAGIRLRWRSGRRFMECARSACSSRAGILSYLRNGPSTRSELEAQAHLKLARIADSAGDLADLRVADARIGQVELWVVEDVERFGSKFEAGLFANHEILEQRHVPIHAARTE